MHFSLEQDKYKREEEGMNGESDFKLKVIPASALCYPATHLTNLFPLLLREVCPQLKIFFNDVTLYCCRKAREQPHLTITTHKKQYCALTEGVNAMILRAMNTCVHVVGEFVQAARVRDG